MISDPRDPFRKPGKKFEITNECLKLALPNISIIQSTRQIQLNTKHEIVDSDKKEFLTTIDCNLSSQTR